MDWARVSKALAGAYGDPRHGNPADPMDCLIYLMLSRKTPIRTAGRALARVQQRVTTWDDLPELSVPEIADALAGSGLEVIRAGHIHQLACLLRDRFGRVTLDPLREWSDAECVAFLTALPGVGAKTALCVMMYSLDRQVFPADAHCIRVLGRLGVIPEGLPHRPAQRLLAQLVPPAVAYTLHVNLLAHGQQVCRARRPQCAHCVVRQHCAHAGGPRQVAAEESPPYLT